MKKKSQTGSIVLAMTATAVSLLAAVPLHAADKNATTRIANQEVALVGHAGSLVLPSMIYGTSGDIIAQADELIAKIDAMQKAGNLKVANLTRHTIYLKTGAQDPARIFGRLIPNLRKLGGAELTNNATAGTIVLVPSFPDPNTQIAIELVGATPAAAGGMTRTPIMLGSRMSVESIGNEQFVASFGLEGLDFYGVGVPPPKNLDEEIDQTVGVLGAVMAHAGMSLSNVVQYNYYVTKGTEPVEATAKLHQSLRKRAPDINLHPSAGTTVVLDGATIPNLRVQLHVIAARGKPDQIAHVPYSEVPTDAAAQSVTAHGVAFVSGIGGVDYQKNGAVAADVGAQIDAAARSLQAALQNAGGLKLSDVARFDVFVKQGEDSAAALADFYKAARKLDPSFDSKQAAVVLSLVQGFPRASTRFLVSAIASK